MKACEKGESVGNRAKAYENGIACESLRKRARADENGRELAKMRESWRKRARAGENACELTKTRESLRKRGKADENERKPTKMSECGRKRAKTCESIRKRAKTDENVRNRTKTYEDVKNVRKHSVSISLGQTPPIPAPNREWCNSSRELLTVEKHSTPQSLPRFSNTPVSYLSGRNGGYTWFVVGDDLEVKWENEAFEVYVVNKDFHSRVVTERL
ncbi:hypothetical protein Tco_0863514 [Tanacetum coccineum]